MASAGENLPAEGSENQEYEVERATEPPASPDNEENSGQGGDEKQPEIADFVEDLIDTALGEKAADTSNTKEKAPVENEKEDKEKEGEEEGEIEEETRGTQTEDDTPLSAEHFEGEPIVEEEETRKENEESKDKEKENEGGWTMEVDEEKNSENSESHEKGKEKERNEEDVEVESEKESEKEKDTEVDKEGEKQENGVEKEANGSNEEEGEKETTSQKEEENEGKKEKENGSETVEIIASSEEESGGNEKGKKTEDEEERSVRVVGSITTANGDTDSQTASKWTVNEAGELVVEKDAVDSDPWTARREVTQEEVMKVWKEGPCPIYGCNSEGNYLEESMREKHFARYHTECRTTYICPFPVVCPGRDEHFQAPTVQALVEHMKGDDHGSSDKDVDKMTAGLIPRKIINPGFIPPVMDPSHHPSNPLDNDTPEAVQYEDFRKDMTSEDVTDLLHMPDEAVEMWRNTKNCPVTGCKTPAMTLKHFFNWHWYVFHEPRIKVYYCPMDSCQGMTGESWTTKRTQDLIQHLKLKHNCHTEDTWPLSIATQIVKNPNYKAPGPLGVAEEGEEEPTPAKKTGRGRPRKGKKAANTQEPIPLTNATEMVDDSIQPAFLKAWEKEKKCPCEGCAVGSLITKASFQQHWTETHVKLASFYICPDSNCEVTVGDKTMHYRSREWRQVVTHLMSATHSLTRTEAEQVGAALVPNNLDNPMYILPKLPPGMGSPRPARGAREANSVTSPTGRAARATRTPQNTPTSDAKPSRGRPKKDEVEKKATPAKEGRKSVGGTNDEDFDDVKPFHDGQIPVADLDNFEKNSKEHVSEDFFALFKPGKGCPAHECTANSCRFQVSDFSRHWKSKHLEIVPQYQCPIKECEFTAKRRLNIKAHLESQHKKRGKVLPKYMEKTGAVYVENEDYEEPVLPPAKNKAEPKAKPDPKPKIQSKEIEIKLDRVKMNDKPSPGRKPPARRGSSPPPSPQPSTSRKQPAKRQATPSPPPSGPSNARKRRTLNRKSSPVKSPAKSPPPPKIAKKQVEKEQVEKVNETVNNNPGYSPKKGVNCTAGDLKFFERDIKEHVPEEFYDQFKAGSGGCPVVKCVNHTSRYKAIDIIRHWKNIHIQVMPMYKCHLDDCTELFKNHLLLRTHLEKSHGLKQMASMTLAKAARAVFGDNPEYVSPLPENASKPRGRGRPRKESDMESVSNSSAVSEEELPSTSRGGRSRHSLPSRSQGITDTLDSIFTSPPTNRGRKRRHSNTDDDLLSPDAKRVRDSMPIMQIPLLAIPDQVTSLDVVKVTSAGDQDIIRSGRDRWILNKKAPLSPAPTPKAKSPKAGPSKGKYTAVKIHSPAASKAKSTPPARAAGRSTRRSGVHPDAPAAQQETPVYEGVEVAFDDDDEDDDAGFGVEIPMLSLEDAGLGFSALTSPLNSRKSSRKSPKTAAAEGSRSREAEPPAAMAGMIAELRRKQEELEKQLLAKQTADIAVLQQQVAALTTQNNALQQQNNVLQKEVAASKEEGGKGWRKEKDTLQQQVSEKDTTIRTLQDVVARFMNKPQSSSPPASKSNDKAGDNPASRQRMSINPRSGTSKSGTNQRCSVTLRSGINIDFEYEDFADFMQKIGSLNDQHGLEEN